jgi:hypothetical protein
VAAILLLILGHGGVPWMTLLGHIALWVVVLIAVVSGVDYSRRFAQAPPAAPRSQ